MLKNTLRIAVVICVCCFVPFSKAYSADLGSIDKNESYDIYYGRGDTDNAFIVRRVKIIRIDQINSLEFLVFINEAGFNARGKEGFILFSKIQAIVPSDTFSISGSGQLNKY